MRQCSPNSSDFFVDTDIDYGQQQLSIVDNQNGLKPMYNEDGSVRIVCNGDGPVLNRKVIGFARYLISKSLYIIMRNTVFIFFSKFTACSCSRDVIQTKAGLFID